jgi:hypothetical protein
MILLRLEVSGCGAVGSVSGLGPEGRQFEPGHPDKRKPFRDSERVFFIHSCSIELLKVILSPEVNLRIIEKQPLTPFSF